MKGSSLVILKGAASILTLLLAIVGILYVLEVFSGEEAQEALRKVLAIMGILTGACLVMVFLARKG